MLKKVYFDSSHFLHQHLPYLHQFLLFLSYGALIHISLHPQWIFFPFLQGPSLVPLELFSLFLMDSPIFLQGPSQAPLTHLFSSPAKCPYLSLGSIHGALCTSLSLPNRISYFLWFVRGTLSTSLSPPPMEFPIFL